MKNKASSTEGRRGVARLAKYSPKCEKWRNFEGLGEILKALTKFPILAKF